MQNEKSNFGSQNPDLGWSKGTKPKRVTYLYRLHLSTKKQTKEKSLKGPQCFFFFYFKNNRHKHGSYDFHNVEVEEPH